MAYNKLLSDQVRNSLNQFPNLIVTEKKMFGGLAFLVNGKMCINVSGDRLMCRFDPNLNPSLSLKKGFEPMIMRGRELKGYGYILPEGYEAKTDFDFWIDQCIAFNSRAKGSKK